MPETIETIECIQDASYRPILSFAGLHLSRVFSAWRIPSQNFLKQSYHSAKASVGDCLSRMGCKYRLPMNRRSVVDFDGCYAIAVVAADSCHREGSDSLNQKEVFASCNYEFQYGRGYEVS